MSLVCAPKSFPDYGDIAQRKMSGKINYYLGHPDHAKHIFQNNPTNYFKKHALTRELLSPILGDGLFITNDAVQWHRDRITANISFDPKLYFEEYTQTLTSLCSSLFDKWNAHYTDGKIIDLNFEFGALILSFVQHSLFTHVNIDSVELAVILMKISELIKTKIHQISWLWNFSSRQTNIPRISTKNQKYFDGYYPSSIA